MGKRRMGSGVGWWVDGDHEIDYVQGPLPCQTQAKTGKKGKLFKTGITCTSFMLGLYTCEH